VQRHGEDLLYHFKKLNRHHIILLALSLLLTVRYFFYSLSVHS
jgi:hypothetical protein